MKILLRERTTGLWLKPCGRWEPSSVNARQFASRAEAVQCSIGLRFPNVEVCFIPEESRLDRLPNEIMPIRSVSVRLDAPRDKATDRWESEGGALALESSQPGPA